ncbi:MAG: hypothetical protein ABI239_05515 [Aquihabitans sp.]
MAKTAVAPDTFRKGEKVVARRELRDVPEGTAGKVILVNGFEWIRYWVLFENGVRQGSINRDALATPDQWKRHLKGETGVFGDEVEEVVEETAVAAGGDGAGVGGAGSASGVTLPSGVVIPQKFIDAAAAARKRLGG